MPHPEQAQSEYSFPSPHASVHARDEDSDDDEAADGGLGRRDDDDELLNALPHAKNLISSYSFRLERGGGRIG